MNRPSHWVFVLTGLGAFLVSLDVSVANALLPAIGSGFHTGDRASVSWVITGYAIVFAAALVPAGRLADRVGRRRTYVVGLLVFGASSTLCGLAPNLPLLIAGRLIQGVGAAAVSPASMGLLLASVDPRQRSIYTARWAGAAAFGICMGPLIGGALTDAGSWRWAFGINVPIALALALATPRVLPETPRQPGRQLPDPLGALNFALAAGAIVLGVSEASDWGFGNYKTLGCLAVGAALAVGFVRRSSRVADPLLDLRLIKQRQIAVATITTVLYASGFFGALLSLILFQLQAWHLSVVQAGVGILPIGLVVSALTTRVGHFSGRVGFRFPIVLGSSLMAVGFVLSAMFDDGAHFKFVWIPIGIVLGLGIGLCYPILGAVAVAGLPAEDLAAATAVNQCARQIGAAFGIAAVVAVLGTAQLTPLSRFHDAWLVCAGFCAVAALVATRISAAASHSTVRARERSLVAHR